MPEKLCEVCPCPEHGFDSCPWTRGVHRHASDVVCGFIRGGDSRWVAETIRQAQRDAGMPGTFGRHAEAPGLPPANGKKEPGVIRLGLVMPCARLGGAERWSEAIVEALSCEGMKWVGFAVVDTVGMGTPGRKIAESMPMYTGEDGVRHLAPYCDVLISWGVPSVVSLTAHSSARRILVCHGLGRFDVDAVRESAHAETLVGVSKDARFSFPPSQRERVIVVPNTVRIGEQKKTKTEIRRGWGVRDEVKVLGWLGRISEEKCPETFVETVKALPMDWVGVMVGPNPQGIADYIAREGVQDRVRAIGAVEDVENTLPGFDALLVPSEREGDCLSAKEAMTMGVPVLMRPTGVANMFPEAVRSINSHDPEGIARIVVEDYESGDGRVRAEWVMRMARRRWNPGAFASRWRKIVRRTAEGTAKPGIFQAIQAKVELCEHRGPRKPGATCGCAASCAIGKGHDGHVSIRHCQDCKIAEEANVIDPNSIEGSPSEDVRSLFDKVMDFQEHVTPEEAAANEEKKPVSIPGLAEKIADKIERMGDLATWEYKLPEMPPKTIKMVMGYDPGSKKGDFTVVMDRPLRVGFIMGCCYRGGSEIWTRTLAKSLDRDKFKVAGFGVADSSNLNTGVFDSFSEIARIGVGSSHCKMVADDSDILISWGVSPHDLKKMVGDASCKIVLVSHGMFHWDSDSGLDVSGIVAVSQSAWDKLPPDVQPIASVIPNGVDPDRCGADMKTRVVVRRQLGIRHDQTMILTLARIDRQKRPLLVVDTARWMQESYPGEFKFVMVGDGLDRDNIIRYAEQTFTDMTFVAGTDNVAPYLAAADFFLQPSSYEADSLAILEAWLAKVPVISTRTGRLVEPRHDLHYAMIDHGNTPQKTGKLIHVLGSFPVAVREMVDSAYAYASEHCTAKAMADRWSDYILALAASAGIPRK